MPQTVFGAAAAVTMLNRAFNNTAPGNTEYASQVAQAGDTADSQYAFARTFGASFDALTDAQLAEQVMGNMGMLPNAPLLAAFIDYLGANAKADRGVIVLQLGQILATQEGATGDMAIYAPQAVAWNAEVAQADAYSANTANTAPFVGEFPTYALTAGAASADEGTTATFELATTNLAAGTEVAYTITGIDAADLSSGALTGKAVVGADGKATISVALAADATTEGEETLTVTIDGQTVTANTKVNDTSLAPQVLTKNVDTIAGTAAAETINGVVSSLSSEGTLNATDVIDGGEGQDTLAVDLKSSFTGFTGSGSVKNVETIALTNAGTIDRTFSAKGVTGASTYELNATGAAVSLSDLAAAGVTVNVNGQTKGAMTVGFAAAAVAGAADALTLGLNKVGTVEVKDSTGAVTTAEAALAVTVSGIETVALNATGANVVNLTSVAAPKYTVAGDGTLKVTAINTGLTSFDASGANGAVTADLTAATGAGAITAVKGGAGDDAFTVDAADLAANVTLEGGAGTNSLTIKGGSGVLQPVMTGFQTLGLRDLGGNVTLSGKNATDLNTISLAAANALGGSTLTVANFAASDLTVKTSGGQSASTVTLTPAANLTYTTAASAAATAAKSAAETVSVVVNAGDATAATINVGAYTKQDGMISVNKASTVAVNVASGKDAAGTSELTSFAATLNAAAATSLTVNATGNLGASTFNVGSAGSVELTASAGSTGVVDVNAAKATNVNITAGGALDLTGSDFAAAEQVTIAQNKGALTGTVALGKVNTLNVSGAATTSAVTLGALGAASQEYAVNVTASGLKGGLTLGGATTKAGISIDLNSMTGASSLGALNGGSVSVNATGALDTVTVGAITAKTSVTYNGAELKNNSATVTAEASSTALTAVLNGGIGDDTYTVNSVATSTSTTVSGDVGIGTNSVTIDGSASTAAGGFTLNASGLTGAGTTTINLTGSSTVKNTITGTGVADVIVGGAAVDTINGGAGGDTITGGAGADVVTGGSGANIFVFAAGANGAAPSSTVFDTITDWTAGTGNKIDFGATVLSLVAEGTIGVGQAAVSATGLATFNSADDTLAERIIAVEAAMTAATAAAGESAVWAQGTDSYLFISDGVAGVGANDVLIKLTGVAVSTGLVVTGGDITTIA